MQDYHIHTLFSADSTLSMEEACRHAVKLELNEIAFTDHMDLGDNTEGYCLKIRDIKQYLHTINTMQDHYGHLLSIRKGIEIGLQPHVIKDAEKMICEYSFDFIIASVHLVNGMDPYLGEYYQGMTKEQSYRSYYEEILRLIKKYDSYSVLGHLDYIKRYSPFAYEEGDHLLGLDVVQEILKTLIIKGKGIEVNTSGYQHSSECPMPHPSIIRMYKELGGEIITIGSDAHSLKHIGHQTAQAIELIKGAGFSYLTAFDAGYPRFIKIK
jgi:histidinol-phosphatase (PHP family)